MNWGIKVLQTSALPLGYVAPKSPQGYSEKLARVAGFEPANDGIRIRCLTAWRYPNGVEHMGWVVGFEPTHTGATILCLNRLTIPTISYRQIEYGSKLATWNGLEPSTSSVTGWHSNQLNYRTTYGGNNRARTYDPLLVRQMLSQLS